MRWLLNYERGERMTAATENTTVILLMIVLAITSFFIAFLSSKTILKTATGTGKRWSMIIIPVIAAVVSVYVFFQPKLINGDRSKTITAINTSFSTGSYPEIDKMYELKNMGYNAVISLLHPAVVPFEPALLEKEKKNAAEAGLEFINIPLLPWVSDNENSIDSLRRLIQNANGKYYIHCYLGVDRIAAATKIIMQEGKAMQIEEGNKRDSLSRKTAFERGKVTELEKGVIIGPQLTKEEYFYVISNFKQVVALRDFSEPGTKTISAEEEKWLQPYKISIKTFEVNENTAPARMEEIVAGVKTLPKPIFIHGFFSTDKALVLFEEIYKKSLK